MIDLIHRIHTTTSEMLATTSRNDPRHQTMETIITLCDELLDHHIDDGK